MKKESTVNCQTSQTMHVFVHINYFSNLEATHNPKKKKTHMSSMCSFPCETTHVFLIQHSINSESNKNQPDLKDL